MEYFLETLFKLIPFLRVTIYIALWAMALGLIFGSVLAAMKLSRSFILKKIAELFTTVIRCTPVIVLLFLSYYGIPLLFSIVGIDLSSGSKTAFSIAALTMYSSATLSEIIRPAYLSINKGQLEAALTVGPYNTSGNANRNIAAGVLCGAAKFRKHAYSAFSGIGTGLSYRRYRCNGSGKDNKQHGLRSAYNRGLFCGIAAVLAVVAYNRQSGGYAFKPFGKGAEISGL